MFTVEFFYPLDDLTNKRIEERFKSLCLTYKTLEKSTELFTRPFPIEYKSDFFENKPLYHGFSIMSELNRIFIANSLGPYPAVIVSAVTSLIRVCLA